MNHIKMWVWKSVLVGGNNRYKDPGGRTEFGVLGQCSTIGI